MHAKILCFFFCFVLVWYYYMTRNKDGDYNDEVSAEYQLWSVGIYSHVSNEILVWILRSGRNIVLPLLGVYFM